MMRLENCAPHLFDAFGSLKGFAQLLILHHARWVELGERATAIRRCTRELHRVFFGKIEVNKIARIIYLKH